MRYSHIATREDILYYEYSTLYIEFLYEEIPHGVDAHLYGRIPKRNIDELEILQVTVQNILDNSLKLIRENYYELTKSIDELTEDILNDEAVINKSMRIKSKVKEYIDKYWEILRKIDDPTNINKLKNEMLEEIKEILIEFKYINIYDGCQVIVEKWKNGLAEDTEIIATSEVYTLGRSREPR